MVGGWKFQSTTTTSSMLASWQPTSKLHENRLLFAKQHQSMYDFTAVADRLTLTVHYAITQCKYIESTTLTVHYTITQHIRAGTTCSRALPSYHLGTLEVALKTKNSSFRGWTTLTMKGPEDSCPRSQATCRMKVRLTKMTAEKH